VVDGDAGALAEIYESYAPTVYRTALRVTGSSDDAQDIVQDLFIGLPEALHTFRGSDARSFRSWIRRCAARQALLHLRERQRRHEVDLIPNRAGPAEDTELDRIQLDGALKALPEILRVAVTLMDLEGFSHDEVAEMLDISPAASRMRLMRGRQLLRGGVAPPMDAGR